MRRYSILGLFVMLAALLVVAARNEPSPAGGQWGGCCGVNRWPMDKDMIWPGNGSMPRHHLAMMWGVPQPYTELSNPLPRTSKTVKAGGAVYKAHCASCHGTTGRGDGEAGKTLKPPPGNLAWLSQMPIAQWDPFIYWTIAEGGVQFGTAMPAFKDALEDEEIWAVTAYIQAKLPQKPQD